MTDIKKIAKLVKIAIRVEQKLSKKAKLKLARKRLQRIAGVDDPQGYGKTDKDKAKSSSEQREDKSFEKLIKDDQKEDDERFVLESKKKTRLAFDESKIKRSTEGSTAGQFTSGGGGDGGKDDSKDGGKDSKDKPDKKEKKTPAEEGTDAVLKDSGFEGVDSGSLDSINEAMGTDDVQIEDVQDVDNGKLITMDDGSEWAQYDSQEDAEEAAKESLQNIFDDVGIEGWSEGFREQFMTVDDVQAREIAIESGESLRESLEEDDLSEEKIEEQINEHIDDVENRIKEDARQYFVQDEGLMSDEEFNKAQFVTIDTDALFQESIDTDGIAHTLAGFDGEEVETKDGKLLYRTN